MIWGLLVTMLLNAPGADAEEGFTPLFDGKGFGGWTTVGRRGTWAVTDDGLLVTQGSGGGWLSTDRTYADFVLRLEYRLPPGGNSGVFIRAPHQGDPAYTGMEIQLLDDGADIYKNLRPGQYCGSVYGVIPTKRGHARGPGEWNEMEITARGSRITVRLNGETVVDGDVKDHPEAAAEHPGINRPEGYIGFQSFHGAPAGDPVAFRKVRIRELKP